MLDKDPENINGGCGIGGHNKMARGTEDRNARIGSSTVKAR